MPRATLDELLIPGQSPYFAMFNAGRVGYTIEEVTSHCTRCGIPLRAKDIQAWQDGAFKNQMNQEMFNRQLSEKRKQPGSRLNPTNKVDESCLAQAANALILEHRPNFDEVRFEDLPKFPVGWKGTKRRFFPCTSDNKPMQQWGWKPADKRTGRPVFDPNLMLKVDAKALSPVGWVGQNMLYQPFIVMDIDGVGHGCVDEAVIQFGNLFRNTTTTFEDPAKPGSFHLYFKTDRIVPVKHFPHAKLDLMGNAVNAAVYFKNKVSNNVPMAELTPQIWDAMMRYQIARKES